MQESLQSAWQNFYVIIGSASATLIGLMFVVMTLLASRRMRQKSEEAIGAFGTPTVVHLCAGLLVALILTAPWPALWQAALLLNCGGLAGVIYMLIVIRRAQRQRHYQPVLEDWVWHVIFPTLAYISFLGAGLALPNYARPALFVIGAAAVLMLLIGIHNAWDTITYLIFNEDILDKERRNEKDRES
ncbi:hypothetical protein [Thermogemmatispora sp.]|uniref:hypothetical protein n=1 Tax=Thermogemmatispora sp. TaxID=1968838 RepID=UPI001D31DCD3|nr:hypothetical protein [Thermogemmatispora sp.]MBX5451942.1 hypothetical protein [Thermogemmatispora sp.]